MSQTGKKKTPSKAKLAVKPAKSTAKSAQPKSKLSRTASKPVAQAQVNVLVWLRAKKGMEAPLERQLKILETASRAEPGCEVFALHRSADHPGDFFLHEIWTSEAALADHRLTPHFKRWVGLQSAILESRRRFIAE